VKVAYVLFDPQTFKEKARADEKDIQDYYNENTGMFKEEKEVKVSQILFKLAEEILKENNLGKIKKYGQ